MIPRATHGHTVILYTDASALVKRYVSEADSDRTARWINDADHIACVRVGYTETFRAISVALGEEAGPPLATFERDWQSVVLLEVDDALVRRAAVIAVGLGVRTLDALHLAAAEQLTGPDFWLLTWGRRMWLAARTLGLQVLPEREP